MKKFTYLKGFLSLFLLAFLTANQLFAQSAAISPTNPTVYVGISTSFTATASGFCGSQRNYNWTASSATPATVSTGNTNSNTNSQSFTWSTPGTYNISVNIFRTGGCGNESATATTTVTVIPIPAPTVIINPPALSISTILTGGTLNLTATRNTDAAWTGGNGNFTYTWSATGPGSVSFTNNPATITGTSSSTVASGFSVAGTYTITCTVQETGGYL